MLDNNHAVFTFGVCENASDTVIVPPDIDETDLLSKVPSGNINPNVGLPVVGKSVALVSSTVTTVVDVTDFNLPPLLTPALTGSFISIIAPGLTTAPESIDVENATTSDSFCSANNTALPNRLACPLDVQANALICFTTVLMNLQIL